jgi:hypothetical protein
VNLPPNRAAWPARYRELYEERAGIIEADAKVSRETAEYRADQDIRKVAAQERQREKASA